MLIGISFFAAGMFYDQPHIAMWIGFMLAGYSAIANDSIQTIGTFIASNKDKKWWVLWLFIGSIFLVTVTYSWIAYGGDVSSGRLGDLNGAGQLKYPQPSSFSFLQIAAPVFLLILTRLRMPVSTTFMLLSSFAIDQSGITSVLFKSLQGYLIAFGAGMIVWLLITRVSAKYFKGKAASWWTIAQWITSGTLWSVWIMQDAANIAVYLPRKLAFVEFLGFAGFIFFGLGFLFYMRGDRIQQIVDEKSQVTDVRPATIIDLIYALILVYKLFISTVPMSTTWVFLGLLAGRELAMSIRDASGSGKPMPVVLRMVGRDVGFALIGLAISVALAVGINPKLGAGLF